ncbi:MAG: hypothetical protein R3F20_16655 [Planctomycetota bacterium]
MDPAAAQTSFTLRVAGLELRASPHELTLLARVGGERPVLSLRVEGETLPLVRTDEKSFRWGDVTGRVRDDGLLALSSRAATIVRARPLLEVAYHRAARGARVGLDLRGGFGLWPTRPRRAAPPLATAESRHALAPGEDLWVMALPVRPSDDRRANERIAHEGQPRPFPAAAYPADEIIEDCARHAEIFAWHAYFWRGIPFRERPKLSRWIWRRGSWMTSRHEPECPEEFARVLATVRRVGMRPLAYLSPRHSRAADLGAEMRRVIADHGFDGLYLDGLADDPVLADAQMRLAREAVGPEGLLYLHPDRGPYGDVALPLPFLEGRADWVLRGANGRGGLDLDTFFRFAVDGRKSSGAAGVWCPYGSRGGLPRDIAPHPDEVRRALAEGVRPFRRSHWRRRPGALEAFDAAHAMSQLPPGQGLPSPDEGREFA